MKSHFGIKKFFFDQRLCYRISRRYTLLFLVVILVMSALCVKVSAELIKRENFNMANVLLEQIGDEFTEKMRNMEYLTNILYFYENVCDAVKRRDRPITEFEQMIEAENVREVLRNIKYMQKDIDSIFLYSLKNNSYYGISNDNGFLFGLDADYMKESEIERILETGGKIRIEIASKEEQIDGERTMFTAYKVIMGNDARTPIGIIKINFMMQALTAIKERVDAFNQGEYFILDEKEQVVYSTYDIDMEEIRDFLLLNMEDADIHLSEIELNGERYYVNIYNEERLQWKFVFLIPAIFIEENSRVIGIVIILVGILAVLLSSLFIFGLARKFTSPIVEITGHLKEIEKGNFANLQLKYEYHDEVGSLINGVNLMSDKIDMLIKREYEAKILAKDVQLRVLRAQINPHFLYNVMENISGIGYSRNIPELSLITENLVDMLRYNTDNSTATVSLGTEIVYVKKYLEIQNYRFGNRIRLETSISDKLLKEIILKFMLQPLVENSVIHGFAGKSYNGYIKIAAWDEDGKLYISVEDNGVGMDEEIIKNLNKNEIIRNAEADSKIHVGISNVSNRIKLYFGEEYGISYESVWGKGTKAVICIPECGRQQAAQRERV